MPKASLTLPSGHLVQLDGTPEEIAELLSLYAARSPSVLQHDMAPPRRAVGPVSAAGKQPKPPKLGPKAHLMALCEAGYFNEKRTLIAVQEKLEEQGLFYPQSSLSTPLIRLVRSHVLRRIKENGTWVYIQS
jgi:hypothetical protein